MASHANSHEIKRDEIARTHLSRPCVASTTPRYGKHLIMLKAAPHARSVFARALSPWAFAVAAALAAAQAFAGTYNEAGGTSSDVRGPAPLISPAMLGGFSGSPFDLGADNYDIRLSGLGLSVPEPSSGLLAALAAVFCAFTTLPRRSRAPWVRTG